MHSPGRSDPDGDHCDRQAEAEGRHRRHAQRELPELEADQQDRDRGRAGDQPTRDAKERDLARRHLGAIHCELAGDLLRMFTLMGIPTVVVMVPVVMLMTVVVVPVSMMMVPMAVRVVVPVSVIVLTEHDLVGMSMTAMREADPRLELVRLGDLLHRLQEAFALHEAEALTGTIGTHGLDENAL